MTAAVLLADAAAALPPVPADQEVLRGVLAEQAVVQTLPAPSFSEYLLHVVRTALETLLAPLFRNFPAESVARGLLFAVLGAALLLLVAMAVRFARRRGRAAPAALGDGRTGAVEGPAEAPARDAAAWRARVDELLGGGDAAAAVEALWWWLAASVARGPVDPAWTTRELLARVGRPDLGTLAVGLDRLAYAPARPQVSDVRALADRVAAAL